MGQKKVSVIVPCYNVSEFIDRCVNSLVEQTMGIENLECIFVDDASKDDTLEKLKIWEKKYPDSILVIACKENQKQGAARNVGLSYATGDYIGFVDSDDYIDREMYEQLYQKALDTACDAVGCFYVRELQNGEQLYVNESNLEIGKLVRIDTPEKRKKLVLEGLPGGVCAGIYRRTVILENQLLFPEKICYEDNYFKAVLLFLLSSYYVMDSCFYHYVVNVDSTVMARNARHHMDRLVIEMMKIETYKEMAVFDQYHDEIEFQFLRLFFINSVRIFFTKFEQIPCQIIMDMQKWVRELFPAYSENPYLAELPPLQQELLKIVEVDLTPDKIRLLAEGYRNVLKI